MPYWRGKNRISLSGTECVIIVLKINDGSWNRVIAERIRKGHDADARRARRLKEFEQKHKIAFRMEGSNMKDICWIPIGRKK